MIKLLALVSLLLLSGTLSRSVIFNPSDLEKTYFSLINEGFPLNDILILNQLYATDFPKIESRDEVAVDFSEKLSFEKLVEIGVITRDLVEYALELQFIDIEMESDSDNLLRVNKINSFISDLENGNVIELSEHKHEDILARAVYLGLIDEHLAAYQLRYNKSQLKFASFNQEYEHSKSGNVKIYPSSSNKTLYSLVESGLISNIVLENYIKETNAEVPLKRTITLNKDNYEEGLEKLMAYDLISEEIVAVHYYYFIGLITDKDLVSFKNKVVEGENNEDIVIDLSSDKTLITKTLISKGFLKENLISYAANWNKQIEEQKINPKDDDKKVDEEHKQNPKSTHPNTFVVFCIGLGALAVIVISFYIFRKLKMNHKLSDSLDMNLSKEGINSINDNMLASDRV